MYFPHKQKINQLWKIVDFSFINKIKWKSNHTKQNKALEKKNKTRKKKTKTKHWI